MKMNPVVHFEMSAENRERMRKFYENVFGWQTNQLGKEMGDYVLVTTTEVDDNQMPKQPGAINGGFYQKMEDKFANQPSVVISVDDLDESIKKVKDAGGKIYGDKQNIAEIGWYVAIIDTEGNRVGMLQPEMK
jgi:predicted enzyme related to lactoylglutathione lyase